MVRNVLAAPDSQTVCLLDHSSEVEAPRLLNVRRLQGGSHVTHSAPRERTDGQRNSGSMPHSRFASRQGWAVVGAHSPPFSWPRVYAELKRAASSARDNVLELSGERRAPQHKPWGRVIAERCSSFIAGVSESGVSGPSLIDIDG